MSAMDGLSMLEIATKKYPDILYVILSGFEEFEYARQSLELGVCSYISKLTLDQDIRKVFPQLKERLDAIKTKEQHLSSIVKEREELRLEKLFSDVLTGRIPPAEEGANLIREYVPQDLLNVLFSAIVTDDGKELQTVLNTLERKLLTQMIDAETYRSFIDEFMILLSGRMLGSEAGALRELVSEEERFIQPEGNHYDEFYSLIRDMAYEAAHATRLTHGNSSYRSVELAKRYVKEHFCEKLALNDIANAVHLSPAYLSAVFTKACGISLGTYICKLRMEKAKEYLRQGYSVAKTAEMTGYTDVRHFSKLFKKSTGGILPSKYAGSGMPDTLD
jgi:two-component system response regulator YesN